MQTLKSVPVELFGKDHYSLLAYIETRCVDHDGILDHRHMRCNVETHPLQYRAVIATIQQWNPDWGTRLKGYWKDDKTKDQALKLPHHDDWDCLDDLAAIGIVKIISMVNGFVQMTDKGNKLVAQLRAFKTKGGEFADFDYQPDPKELN
jgi:hypothetical protein